MFEKSFLSITVPDSILQSTVFQGNVMCAPLGAQMASFFLLEETPTPLQHGGRFDLSQKSSVDVEIKVVTLGLFERIARFFAEYFGKDTYLHTRFSHHKALYDSYTEVRTAVADLLTKANNPCFNCISEFSTRLG